MCPLITPSPEGSTVNFNSPMKATGPMAGAPARKRPVVSNRKLPSTPALVQVGEPCFTPSPDEIAPGFWKRKKKPVDVTTKEATTFSALAAADWHETEP